MTNLIMNPSITVSRRFNIILLCNNRHDQSTLLERIFNELDLEPLAERRWYRRMFIFYKIVKNLAPKYLQSYLLLQALNQYLTANSFTFKNSIIISQLKEYKLNLLIKKFLH